MESGQGISRQQSDPGSAALILSALLPVGHAPAHDWGAYLCFEGCEKLLHKFLHRHEEVEAEHAELAAATANPNVDMVVFEKEKIAGAVRTDFVLSAEIIVIALGTVKDVPWLQRIFVLIAIATVMTVGVYGLVAGIIKLDDVGLALTKRSSSAARVVGRGILRLAPYLLKTLSVVGTAAMFIVGGGILTHGIPVVHDVLHHWVEAVESVAVVGWLLGPISSMLLDAAFGILVGAVAVVVFLLGKTSVEMSRSDWALRPYDWQLKTSSATLFTCLLVSPRCHNYVNTSEAIRPAPILGQGCRSWYPTLW